MSSPRPANAPAPSDSQPKLIDVEAGAVAAPRPFGKVRIAEPQRRQGEIRFEVPEDLLEVSHPARLIWNVLGMVPLGRFGADCMSVEGAAGRSLKSPRMLLTLWMYAISQGVGSAREIARLTRVNGRAAPRCNEMTTTLVTF